MKRHDAQHWKPIVQTGNSQLTCSTQENRRLQDHLKALPHAPTNAQHELSDTAADPPPPFEFDDIDDETPITIAFLFFLYGTFCGSVWSFFIFWLFQ